MAATADDLDAAIGGGQGSDVASTLTEPASRPAAQAHPADDLDKAIGGGQGADEPIVSASRDQPKDTGPKRDMLPTWAGGGGGKEAPKEEEQPSAAWLTPKAGAIGRIARAAEEGAQTDPSNPLYAGPIGHWLIEPAAKIAGGVFRGGQQFVEEALPIPGIGGGPTLGHELAALPEAFPTGTDAPPTRGYPEMAPQLRATEDWARAKAARAAEIRDNIAAGRNPLERPTPDYPRYGEEAPREPPPIPPDVNIGPVPKPSAQGPTSPVPSEGGVFLDNRWVQEHGAEAATGDQWRPVQPGETFQPGRSFRMNQTTGTQEVLEPGTAGGHNAARARGDLAQSVQAALDRGDAATYHTADGQEVPITSTEGHSLIDEHGQKWNADSIGADSTGREGVFIAPEGSVRPGSGTVEEATRIPEGEGAERSAGAAGTPYGQIPDPNLAQRAQRLRVAINQSAKDRAGADLRDDEPYVTNIPERIEAERNFDPQVSLDHRTRLNDPDYRRRYDDVNNERNTGMVDNLANDAGDGNTLDDARAIRRESAPDKYGAFDNQRPSTKAQAVLDYMDKILREGGDKRGAVVRTFKSVRDSMHDAEGNLEVMPNRIFASRANTKDLLEKAVAPKDAEGTDAQVAQIYLHHIQDLQDDAISDGAPKYDDWRTEYRRLSQTVNQQRFLQRYQGGSKNVAPGGELSLQRLNKMLEDIHAGLTDQGTNLAKSLTDQQIWRIIDTRNELAARQLAMTQGKAIGSPTYQYIQQAAKKGIGPLGYILQEGLAAAMHGAEHYGGIPGASVAGQIYSVAAPSYSFARKAQRAAKAERLTQERDNYLLQQPSGHPLSPPS